MSRVRIILSVADGSDGILALRAARALLASDHRDCVYAYDNGASIWAKRNKASVTAREIIDGRAA